MALDYITGLMCAVIDKKLSSAVGFKGICKKVLILMLVGVANVVDIHIVGTGSALRSAVICFYLSNEGLSLLENAAHIGLPIPDKMKDVLAQLHGRTDEINQTDDEHRTDESEMSERINTPFTNEHFVAFCEKMVGQPYWYGSVVYKCTENLRARKAKQYPAHYGSSRTARYRDDIAKKKVCADCVGLIKGYNWTNGGQGVIESIGTDRTFSSKYGAHGCRTKVQTACSATPRARAAPGVPWTRCPRCPALHCALTGMWVCTSAAATP